MHKSIGDFLKHVENPVDYSTKIQTKKIITAIDGMCHTLKHLEVSKLKPSVPLNITHTHQLEGWALPGLTEQEVLDIYSDGRVFSHFIEKWLSKKYPLVHVTGCKKFDFYDAKYPSILYDEKTFTRYGCKFCPSNMLGQGRSFDKEKFVRKSDRLIFCIVSSTNLPEVKVKFVRGSDLARDYPQGVIPSKDQIKFFD